MRKSSKFTTVFGSDNDAEILQNPLNFHGFGKSKPFWIHPGCREEPRRVPVGSPQAPWGAPGEPQDPPRAPLELPKVAPGSPKGGPRSPRSSQKHPQEGKMEARTLPKSVLKPTSVKNHIRMRFSTDFPIDFPPKSLAKTTGESIANCVAKLRRSGHR